MMGSSPASLSAITTSRILDRDRSGIEHLIMIISDHVPRRMGLTGSFTNSFFHWCG